MSLYSLDAHTVKAARLVSRFAPTILLTPLVELELTNALQLRAFGKEASAAEIRMAQAELKNHIADGFFAMVAMPVTVYELGRRIAVQQSSNTGTRTLDILHVASAMLLRAEKFWTFDRRQEKLAQGAGLKLR